MPLKVYCPNSKCSEPILYDLTKPIMCPFCGTNLNSNTSFASQKPKKIVKIKELEKELEDEPEEIDEDLELNDEPENRKHKLFGQTGKSKRNKNRREINEDIDVDELNISSLQLDVPISTKKDKGVTLGQVMKEEKTGFVRPKPKKVNKKAELEAFRLEAGLGGRKDISIEDNQPE